MTVKSHNAPQQPIEVATLLVAYLVADDTSSTEPTGLPLGLAYPNIDGGYTIPLRALGLQAKLVLKARDE